MINSEGFMRLLITRLLSAAISLLVIIGFQGDIVGASEVSSLNAPASTEVELPKADDLSALGASARKEHLPILLMYSAEDCDYCQQLESEVLRPMMISGELNKKVIFRKIDVDDMTAIRDFHGKDIDPEKFAYSKGVQVTPTLQFLDGNGEELAPKIIGYQGSEFFAAYLDSAIFGSQEKLSKQQY